MKDSPSNAKKLLDLPYAPEAEKYLDELERTGQFRVGLEAELEEAESSDAPSNEYSWGRGSGIVSIQDWWTNGKVVVRLGPGLTTNDLVLARVNDSLLIRTQDGFDRLTLEGYLGLIPDASTLRIVFNDGSEWAGGALLTHIASWFVGVSSEPPPEISQG